MATLTKSTGTVALSGAVEKVTFPAVYGWVWVKNMSDSDIFAGLSANISKGSDGVMTISVGECGRVQTDGQDSVYLMGSGNALVVAQNYADCPFKSGGKGGVIIGENLLMNPDFKVNQRGKISTVGTTGYTVDGWFMAKHSSAANAGNFQVLTGSTFGSIEGIELTTNGTRLDTYFRQRFENTDYLAGKTVTLSFKVETPNANDWLVSQFGIQGVPLNVDENGIGHLTFVWDGSQSYQAIQFYNNVPNTTLKIYWVKLEVGANATPFVPPEHSAELLKCQRYYQIRSENNIAAVDLRPNMRDGVVPTITALADGNYSYSTEL